MKTIKKISIILAVVFFVSLIMSILTGLMQLFPGFESASINQSESLPQNGIEKLDINLLDTQLNVHSIKGQNLEFNLTGTYAKNQYNNSIKLFVERIDNTAKVEISYPPKLIIINRQLHLDVGVPEDYQGDFEITTASGNIYFLNINAKRIEVKSASGNINLINSSCTNLISKSASGNVFLNEVNASESSYTETISGNVKIKNLATEYSEFKSVSGKISIENSTKINSAETTSGNIDIENAEITYELSIKSISGNINLDAKDNSSIDLKFESISGNLENSFGNIYNGRNKVYVKTTSGDFIIY